MYQIVLDGLEETLLFAAASIAEARIDKAQPHIGLIAAVSKIGGMSVRASETEPAALLKEIEEAINTINGIIDLQDLLFPNPRDWRELVVALLGQAALAITNGLASDKA